MINLSSASPKKKQFFFPNNLKDYFILRQHPQKLFGFMLRYRVHLQRWFLTKGTLYSSRYEAPKRGLRDASLSLIAAYLVCSICAIAPFDIFFILKNLTEIVTFVTAFIPVVLVPLVKNKVFHGLVQMLLRSIT